MHGLGRAEEVLTGQNQKLWRIASNVFAGLVPRHLRGFDSGFGPTQRFQVPWRQTVWIATQRQKQVVRDETVPELRVENLLRTQFRGCGMQ